MAKTNSKSTKLAVLNENNYKNPKTECNIDLEIGRGNLDSEQGKDP